MAHQTAGRMFSVNETIALQKKVDSGVLVEVVHCKDCRFWGDASGKGRRYDGEWYAMCTMHHQVVDGHRVGWCPVENDFCSLGMRRRKDECEESET